MGIDTIKPIDGQFDKVPNHIQNDTRYWPHFKVNFYYTIILILFNSTPRKNDIEVLLFSYFM